MKRLSGVSQTEVDFFPPIRVISLAGDQERRRIFTERYWQHLRCPVEFFDAVDGTLLSPSEYDIYSPYRSVLATGYELNAGEIGCYLSHLRALKQADDHDLFVVMEDDTVFSERLFEFLAMLARSDWRDFDMLRLVPHRPEPGRARFRVGDVGIFRPARRIMNAQGYVVPGKNAARVRAALGRRMVRSVDSEISRFWSHGLRVFVTDPPLVWSNEHLSSRIGTRGHHSESGHQSWWRRRFIRLLRLGWRAGRIN